MVALSVTTAHPPPVSATGHRSPVSAATGFPLAPVSAVAGFLSFRSTLSRMSRFNPLPSLALGLLLAFLAVQVDGRAFFGTLFQDAQLNNGTLFGFGGLNSFLEALAAFHESHSLTDLSNAFLGK